MRRLGRLLLGAMSCAAVLACGRSLDVDLDDVTTLVEGQRIEDDGIELVEGQAVGVEATALSGGDPRPGASIEVESSDERVVEVFETIGPDTKRLFVVSGRSPGEAELEFLIKGRTVLVPVLVTPRPDWTPTVSSQVPMGGAGGR